MMRKILGGGFMLLATWCMMSPQAQIGLQELKWMAKYAFPAEALLGCVFFTLGFWAFNLERPKTRNEQSNRH